MSVVVKITPIIDHKEYNLNGHKVYKDSLNNWSCKVDLSTKELAAFKRYEKQVIKNPAFTTHTVATYKL